MLRCNIISLTSRRRHEMEKNNPFDTMSIADIETRARVERAIVMGKLVGMLFKFIGRQMRKVGTFLDMIQKSNCVAARSDYYIDHPEELKNKFL